jgi:hypothetical protein
MVAQLGKKFPAALYATRSSVVSVNCSLSAVPAAACQQTLLQPVSRPCCSLSAVPAAACQQTLLQPVSRPCCSLSTDPAAACQQSLMQPVSSPYCSLSADPAAVRSNQATLSDIYFLQIQFPIILPSKSHSSKMSPPRCTLSSI